MGCDLGPVERQLAIAKLIHHDLAGLERGEVGGETVLRVVCGLNLTPIDHPLNIVGGL